MRLKSLTSLHFFVLLAILILSSALSSCSKTKTVSSNGYTYQTVDGDPLNTRIYTLNNGLKVYMTVYKDAPRIQTAIAVKVGHKNDPPDNTGMAHYLEHLLFKGTDEFGTLDWSKEKVEIQKITDLFEAYRKETGPAKRTYIYHQIDSVSGVAAHYAIANEYDKLLASMGATGTNAFTSVEQTVYVNDIPGNQLDKWLKVEKERFEDPVLRLFHTELEVVYEEKNRAMDNDGRKAAEALLSGLFQKHQYGTETTLGRIEHLKNPSMKSVVHYFRTYYVPNNMAICLSGDLDPEETIKKIDATFGQFKAKELPKYSPPVEEPIEKPRIKEVLGPDAESVTLAFRLPGINSKEADLLTMLDMILMNGHAGLIDINLNQKQKVIGAYSSPRLMADYSYHSLGARPRQGQSLEDVKSLLLSQIDSVKEGKFSDWLPKAALNDLKLRQIHRYESNWGRAYAYIQSFTSGTPWENTVTRFDRLAKISKQDLVDFANHYYHDNYVVVYKRTGKDKNIRKISKPKITPVELNRSAQSDFFKNIAAMKTDEVKPVFLDFKKDIKRFSIKNNIPVYYKKNDENDLFELYYRTDTGTDANLKLGVALHYLPYLGTSKYSPQEIKQEFYKIGCSFRVNSTGDQIWVSLSGLRENFKDGLKLFEHLLTDAQPNAEALTNLVKDILKKRADQKLNKSAILWGAMNNYGIYGPKSSFTHVLSTTQLQALSAEELVALIHNLNSFEHRILYYGPDSPAALTAALNEIHTVPDKLTPPPAPLQWKELATDKNKVYVVDYDMKQAEIIMLSKSSPFNNANLPVRALFNEYYGGNMSSVVFQTMRESKALAYSVYATYRTPSKKENAHYVFAYIGTQADKLGEAMDGFKDLLNNMPESEFSFNASKEAIIKRIAPERITKSDILFRYERAKKLGLDYDVRKDLWEKVPELTLADIRKFHNRFIKGNKYTVLVLGNTKKLDKRILKKFGAVRYLTLEDIFGY